MQYLLSEIEYQALVNQGKAEAVKVKHALQKACTLAALHTPARTVKDYSKPGFPSTKVAWGCILDKTSGMEYCDCCPVKDICPNEWKEWSK